MSAAALPFVPPPAPRMGERAGLVAAVALHVALFGALSLRWGAPPPPPAPAEPAPIEVSLVRDVAPVATAPPAPVPPAASVAPAQGEPEETAPPPVPAPEPVRAAPKPEPVKAAPAPAPKPVKPRPQPEPVAKAEPKPEPEPVARAEPKPKPVAVKPAPSKHAAKEPADTPAPAKAAARPAPERSTARPSRLAGLGQELAAGAKADAHQTRGHRLGADFLSGLAADAPAKKASAAAPAAKAGPFPSASILQAIQRQIQPCADRQVSPGPGANEIATAFAVSLNQDGTLAATPRIVRQSGKTDENERYAQRVADMGIAAFKGCTPLRLPAEYYQTPSGGWSSIIYNWKPK